MLRFDIITIFPDIFDSYINESILKRALKEKLISIVPHDLRDFTADKHKKVDDRPYGGGPGMVIKIEPVYKAVSSIKHQASGKKSINPVRSSRGVLNPASAVRKQAFIPAAETAGRSASNGIKNRVILFSTRGKKLNGKIAARLSKYDQLILICGRYEGVDERAAKYIADEEISIGDFVLSGGELPALILIESVCRFIPGFLGKRESLEEFKGSYPTYTKPAEFILPESGRKFFPKMPAIWKVPDVLLSGDHKKIDEYRKRKRS